MDGILNINKATGMTSHDVVACLRKILRQRRIGHTGTLDPAASGVLPICVGQATRVAEYLSESGKAYRATLRFGIVTDTYDIEGAVIRTDDPSTLTIDQIEKVLPNFLGSQMQVPPRYSAIKLQGQPAYKLARAGEVVTLEPRKVEITELRIVDWQNPSLILDIECSKGTYIRSLAYDLGEQLGCGAHLTALIRTRSGPFTLADSITLEQVTQAQEEGTLSNFLYTADHAVLHYPALYLDEDHTRRVLHGNIVQFPKEDNPPGPLARLYDHRGRFLAIAARNEEHRYWQPKKVLAENNL